jgi:Zn-dependent peptidase ImmA (M78 family)
MAKADLILKKEVSEFRDKLGLNPTEPVNVHGLLLKINVLAVFKPMSEGFSGMAVRNEKGAFILINSNQAIGRQNFTIGHELYHLFVQSDFTPHTCVIGHFDPAHKEEMRADLFSAELLMPEDGLIELIPREQLGMNKITLGTILKIEQIMSVSRSALLYRLKSLGLINDLLYNKYKDNVIKSAIDYGFVTTLYKPGNANTILGDYGQIANELFESGKISEGHFMELMSIFAIDEQL